MDKYPTAVEMRKTADEHSKQRFVEEREQEWKTLWELIQSSAVEGLYQCSMPVVGRSVKDAQCIWGEGLQKLKTLGYDAQYLMFGTGSGLVEVSWAGKDVADNIMMVDRL